LHEIFRQGWQWANEHRLGTGIIFQIRHYWEIRKLASTDCAARRCTTH